MKKIIIVIAILFSVVVIARAEESEWIEVDEKPTFLEKAENGQYHYVEDLGKWRKNKESEVCYDERATESVIEKE